MADLARRAAVAAVDRAAREDAHADAVGEAHEEEVLNVLRRAHPVLATAMQLGSCSSRTSSPNARWKISRMLTSERLPNWWVQRETPRSASTLPGKAIARPLTVPAAVCPSSSAGGLLHEAEDVLPLPPLGGPPDAGEHPAAQVADHAGESGEVDVQPDDEVVLQVDVEAGGVASRALRPDGQLTEDAPLEQDGAEVGDAAPAQPGEGLDLPLGDGRVGADAVKDAFHIGAAHVVMVHGALQGEAPFL